MSDNGYGTVNVIQKPKSVYFTWIFKELWQTEYYTSLDQSPIKNSMTSPAIKATVNGNEHIWKLQIHASDERFIDSTPTFVADKVKGVLSLRLNDSECNTDVDVKVECSIINDNGTMLNSKITTHTFTKKSACIDISDFPYCYDFINTPPIEWPETRNINVGVVCEITYNCNAKPQGSNDNSSIDDVINLSNDLKLLFHNEKFSDLTIVVEQQEFHVHKAILASRSPVFLAMLENDMAEKQNNRVEIADIDYETMKHLLIYVYTGKVEKLDLAIKLLGPADKYALDRLKNMCAEVLVKDLTVENVVKILVMADLYGISKLKKEALNFMGKHFHEVTQTEGFESLLKPNSDLFKTF